MRAKNMALCGLFAALLTVCAWLHIPIGDISFTMQTFGVFLALGLLGGKRGAAAISIYLLLGIVGLPVFSGFRGGLGVLMGVSGGYIWGFLVSGLVYWGLTARKSTPKRQAFAMVMGLLACYLCGTAWYMGVYLPGGNAVGLGAVLLKCVVPYLLPDAAKLLLAHFLTQKLRPFV